MNDLSNAALRDHQRNTHNFKPIPKSALYILISLFLIGFSVSLFILIVVHNAVFFLSLIFLSILVASFLVWNSINWRHNNRAAVSSFLRSLPDSDLGRAREGQLVKITGVVSCGSESLESSYEKASRCIYTSTLLYEHGQLGLRPVNVNKSCFQWRLVYCERFSSDFYITDRNSGIRAMVKAGSNCEVVPLIIETKLISTTTQCTILSSTLKKWLRERNLPSEARRLRLEEGYVQEGSSVTVIGTMHRNNDALTIVQPPEVISTGCLWRRLLLPIDVKGLIIGVSASMTDSIPMSHLGK